MYIYENPDGFLLVSPRNVNYNQQENYLYTYKNWINVSVEFVRNLKQVLWRFIYLRT